MPGWAPKACCACKPGTPRCCARIGERVPEAARQDELKAQAERLNPDTWVTDDEVRVGLESYESVLESLRGVVGQGRRRRRRGPGRPDGEPSAGAVPARRVGCRGTRRRGAASRTRRRAEPERGAGIISLCESQLPDA